ncbi:MAG: hypothetical protein NZR01_12285 [Bryobacteraceae bacterium]|nr:hypothetical protein [Bryobacteraceae bacterium]
MGTAARNAAAIVLAGAGVFALAVLLGLRITPPPRTSLDYLVIGSVATFLMLGVVFGLVLALWIKPQGLPFRRRKKQPGDDSAGSSGGQA